MPAPATLATYEQQTVLLLNDPTFALYNVTDIDTYINSARGQIAVASQCLRYTSSLTTAATINAYTLAAFSAPSGIQGAIDLRMLARATSGSAQAYMEKRPWEWFFKYQLCANPLAPDGPPAVWSIQEPGILGSVTFYPTPDQPYIINANTIGYPQDLLSDNSIPELLPYTWTDAVSYYAAYLAYLGAQREADAQQMFQRFITFMVWATRQSTSTVLAMYDPGGRGTMEAGAKIVNTGVGMPAPARGGGGAPGLPG